jgi:ankyrin repeat protein
MRAASSHEEELPPLLRAARAGDAAALAAQLAAGADVGQCAAWFGSTALHLAAHGGHEACVRALLQAGAEKETKNEAGKRAFDYARENGHASLVQLLAEAPSAAAVAERRRRDAAAAEAAAAAAAAASAAEQRRCAAANERLLQAARVGDAAAARACLRDGAACDAQDRFGHSALILAAAKGARDCCEALLEGGASRTLRNGMGQTAAEAARARGHDALEAMLQPDAP